MSHAFPKGQTRRRDRDEDGSEKRSSVLMAAIDELTKSKGRSEALKVAETAARRQVKRGLDKKEAVEAAVEEIVEKAAEEKRRREMVEDARDFERDYRDVFRELA
jgi:hypothetical protein